MLESHKDYCPYCGELIEVVIDPSESDQQYIEDCFVCCRPISITIHINDDELSVQLSDENSV